MKRLRVETKDSHYDLVIGSNFTDQFETYLKKIGVTRKTKILLVTDTHLAPLHLDFLKKALYSFDYYEYIVPAGEIAKSLEQVEKITTFMIENGFDRTSFVFAFGGGVVGDLGGFVASIYMRGIPFIQCPTTILAHDSSIGGKVAVNHPLGKNLIGAFHQPKLVLYDTQFLKTLPNREIRSGLVEVVKHGLIADEQFISWLYQNADALLKLELVAVNEALYQGSNIKARIVKEDEYENGIRAILNFGHTLGHAIETLSNYQYTHGEAVAIGMAFVTRLSRRMGYITTDVQDYYLNLMRRFQFPTEIPSDYDSDEIIKVMMRDKKFKENKVRMILPTGIGQVSIIEGITFDLLKNAIEETKGR